MDKEEAKRLFTALRSELTLLEGDTVLTVHAELRNTLLPLLETENASRVQKIDRICVDFWMTRAEDDAAAAEVVYHALRIGDLTRATGIWRSSLARYLGGYAMEELPLSSQAWLEGRLSRQSSELAAFSAVAEGDFPRAAGAIAPQTQQVETLSAGRRARTLRALSGVFNVASLPPLTDQSVLESIVLAGIRPAIQVHDNTFSVASPQWAPLEHQRPTLEVAVRSTGRVQLGDGTVLGTAARVGPDLFITTRSVVDRFAVGSGKAAVMINGRAPTIDMRAEGDAVRDVHPIERVELMHPYWDVAIFKATMRDSALPLTLATQAPAHGSDIVVIGHPGRNEQESDLLSRLLDSRFSVKRLMPGKYLGEHAELSLGRTVQAGHDDAIALSDDLGAPVIDVVSGELLGVRFSWVFLEGAKFVPAWELARDPEIARLGIAISGSPQPAPAWTSAWQALPPARSVLLAAYVSYSAGDAARAHALLESVNAEDDAVQIEHTLLRAACILQAEPLRAADLLHHLLTNTPREAWPARDRDAVVATRLRLTVDAEAETDFLRILRDHDVLAGLLEPPQFRVLSPPQSGVLWRQSADLVSAIHGLGDETLPAKALEMATRITQASQRCVALAGWIESDARELASLSYLMDREATELRSIAAAHVAFPYEMVARDSHFLLDKTDLAPHPTKGWSPVIEPLSMLFREAGGRYPDGVKTEEDLTSWLDTQAKSGRLGSYLVELLRVESQTAWQAGLLHLTTELPIERLLQRRFSGPGSS